MNLHTVTKHGQTKTGKPVVYFDGKTGYQDMVFLGKTAAPPVGAVIDTEMTSMPRQDGGTMWFLNKWGMAPAGTQAPAPAIAQPAIYQPASPTQHTNGSAPPAGYTEPERLWLSNIVAAAISSGKVADPCDLPAWVNAALYALRNAKTDMAMPTERADF